MNRGPPAPKANVLTTGAPLKFEVNLFFWGHLLARWEVNEEDTNNQLLSLVYSNQNLPKEKLCATYEIYVISQKGLMLFKRIFNCDQKPRKFEKDQEKR